MDDELIKTFVQFFPDLALSIVFGWLFLREQKAHHELMVRYVSDMRKFADKGRESPAVSGKKQE